MAWEVKKGQEKGEAGLQSEDTANSPALCFKSILSEENKLMPQASSFKCK